MRYLLEVLCAAGSSTQLLSVEWNQTGAWALIVSNDLFRVHIDDQRVDKRWIKEHTLCFTFTLDGKP